MPVYSGGCNCSHRHLRYRGSAISKSHVDSRDYCLVFLPECLLFCNDEGKVAREHAPFINANNDELQKCLGKMFFFWFSIKKNVSSFADDRYIPFVIFK